MGPILACTIVCLLLCLALLNEWSATRLHALPGHMLTRHVTAHPHSVGLPSWATPPSLFSSHHPRTSSAANVMPDHHQTSSHSHLPTSFLRSAYRSSVAMFSWIWQKCGLQLEPMTTTEEHFAFWQGLQRGRQLQPNVMRFSRKHRNADEGSAAVETAIYTAAWEAVANSFIDKRFNGVDWTAVKAKALAVPLNNRDATYRQIRQSYALLGDPFTRFIDPAQYHNVNRRLTGRLVGVGIAIAPAEGDDDKVVVVEVFPGTPAESAGIAVGDVLVTVDSSPVHGLSHWEIARQIEGELNAVVTLDISKPGQGMQSMRFIRQAVDFKTIQMAVCKGVSNQRWGGQVLDTLGYICVPSFANNGFPEFLQAMRHAIDGGAKGIVLDLRGNSGGSVQTAYSMASAFLGQGEELVRIVGRDGAVRSHLAMGECYFPDLPVALLVDNRSASSSEMLAAALQGRAVIAGAQTFGKGLIQEIRVLPDQSAVVVTVERYLTRYNEEINKVGVVPTVAVDEAWLARLPTEAGAFCKTLEEAGEWAPPLFSGSPAEKSTGKRQVPDLDRLPAFC